MLRRLRRIRLRWWIVTGVVVVAVLAVGGPFVYIHLIEGPAPAKLSLPGGSRSTSKSSRLAPRSPVPGADGDAGIWRVGAGSIAGYRVQEILIGQHSTAVGRTTEIAGSLVIQGSKLVSATFTVDMASVKSDQSERNAQFDGRIMDVSSYPTASFALTGPVELGTVSDDAAVHRYRAIGELTMHGATAAVSFPLEAEWRPGAIDVLADVPVTFSRWNIANPSVAGFVTTASSGTLEVLLQLTRGEGNQLAAVAGAPSGGTSAGGPPGAAGHGRGGSFPKGSFPKGSLPKGSLHHRPPGGLPGGSGGAPSQVTVPRTTTPVLTIPKDG